DEDPQDFSEGLTARRIVAEDLTVVREISLHDPNDGLDRERLVLVATLAARGNRTRKKQEQFAGIGHEVDERLQCLHQVMHNRWNSYLAQAADDRLGFLVETHADFGRELVLLERVGTEVNFRRERVDRPRQLLKARQLVSCVLSTGGMLGERQEVSNRPLDE